MATSSNGTVLYSGIVYSITPVPQGQQPTTGQVQEDETGDIFSFSDPNFPNTGLQVNSTCSFSLTQSPKDPSSWIAGTLEPLTMNPPQIINQSVTENITAILGNTIKITNGATLTGSVTINGGRVVVEASSAINGPVNVTAGGMLVAKGGQVGGGMININTGGSIKAVQGGSVQGNAINISQAGRVIAGNMNDGTGTIGTAPGTLSVLGIRGITVAEDGTSAING